ncbi:hypothetical protein J2W40_000590 [Sphingobium xenophagum]|uniref:Lipoprotein n=1 Tax=Sphingobium xenophagum TaxID=121428 RepID=A0ABU1WWV9_SPHXE|nr:hypothetical protein [Sphingobium xenophagum]MDR7153793.1 hypothetical protein [Sphingobium xenophagum]
MKPQASSTVAKLMVGLGLCIAVAPYAQACPTYTPQEVLASRPYDRIVAATIVSVVRGASHKPRWEPWSATAKTISSAKGIADDSLFSLSRNFVDCDDGEPTPKVGEIWILYLKWDGSKYYPFYSLPFAEARKMDARFGRSKRIQNGTPPPHIQ